MSPRLLPSALLVLLTAGCSSPRQAAGTMLVFGSIVATGIVVAHMEEHSPSSPSTSDDDSGRVALLTASATALAAGVALMLPPSPRPAASDAAPAPSPPRDAPGVRRGAASVSSAPLPTACPPGMVCLPATE